MVNIHGKSLIKREVVYLLYCYLNFQRRLCYQRADNYGNSWNEGFIFYIDRHRNSMKKAMLKLEEMRVPGQAFGHIHVGCFDVIKHHIRGRMMRRRNNFCKYVAISPRMLGKIYRVFENTDRIFTSDQHFHSSYMIQNSRFAGYLMRKMDIFFDCELKINKFYHMEDISFSLKPPMSINALMMLNFDKSEDEILHIPWRPEL